MPRGISGGVYGSSLQGTDREPRGGPGEAPCSRAGVSPRLGHSKGKETARLVPDHSASSLGWASKAQKGSSPLLLTSGQAPPQGAPLSCSAGPRRAAAPGPPRASPLWGWKDKTLGMFTLSLGSAGQKARCRLAVNKAQPGTTGPGTLCAGRIGNPGVEGGLEGEPPNSPRR